jgi:peptidoglycan/LPS O-acetylase OafA/YrhL
VSIPANPFVVVVEAAQPAPPEPGGATMTAATPTLTTTGTRTSRSLRRTTVLSGVVAAVVVTAAAAMAHAAGVSFEIDGETIPLAGFAQMTLLGAVVGGVLLAVLNRRSSAARTRFVQTSVVLTALSCIPSVAWPDDTATKVVLVATHLIAAAIVVPALARHAND